MNDPFRDPLHSLRERIARLRREVAVARALQLDTTIASLEAELRRESESAVSRASIGKLAVAAAVLAAITGGVGIEVLQSSYHRLIPLLAGAAASLPFLRAVYRRVRRVTRTRNRLNEAREARESLRRIGQLVPPEPSLADDSLQLAQERAMHLADELTRLQSA